MLCGEGAHVGQAVEMAVEGISEYQLVRWSFLVTLP